VQADDALSLSSAEFQAPIHVMHFGGSVLDVSLLINIVGSMELHGNGS